MIRPARDGDGDESGVLRDEEDSIDRCVCGGAVVPEIGDEYALMTVSSAADDAVEAMLPRMFWTPVKGLAAEVFRREPSDGVSVTFAVRFRRYGFRLQIH